MSKYVTQKQRDLVADMQETFNPQKSVERIYGYSKEVANKTTSRIITAPGIRGLMNDPRFGLDDRHLLDRLKQALKASKLVWSKTRGDWLEDTDWGTQMKALELAFKLKGYLSTNYNPEGEEKNRQITVNFNLVKARDTEEVKKIIGTEDVGDVDREAVLEKIGVLGENKEVAEIVSSIEEDLE